MPGNQVNAPIPIIFGRSNIILSSIQPHACIPHCSNNSVDIVLGRHDYSASRYVIHLIQLHTKIGPLKLLDDRIHSF